MNTNKNLAKILGICFTASFLCYGIGNSLIDAVLDSSNPISIIKENKTSFVFGLILMAIIHTVFNTILAVIMLQFLKIRNKIIAHIYFTLVIVATIMLIIGAVFLFLILPLGDVYKISIHKYYLETLTIVCKNGNFYAYQIGMSIWAIAGLLFCYLLNKLKLVPNLFVIWGMTGYTIFIVGCLLELFGYNIGVWLSIPGGLFEIGLSIWLIIKGFKTSLNIKTNVR